MQYNHRISLHPLPNVTSINFKEQITSASIGENVIHVGKISSKSKFSFAGTCNLYEFLPHLFHKVVIFFAMTALLQCTVNVSRP